MAFLQQRLKYFGVQLLKKRIFYSHPTRCGQDSIFLNKIIKGKAQHTTQIIGYFDTIQLKPSRQYFLICLLANFYLLIFAFFRGSSSCSCLLCLKLSCVMEVSPFHRCHALTTHQSQITEHDSHIDVHTSQSPQSDSGFWVVQWLLNC